MSVIMKCSNPSVPDPYFCGYHFVPEKDGTARVWFQYSDKRDKAKIWDSEFLAREEIEFLAPSWIEQSKHNSFSGEMIFETV